MTTKEVRELLVVVRGELIDLPCPEIEHKDVRILRTRGRLLLLVAVFESDEPPSSELSATTSTTTVSGRSAAAAQRTHEEGMQELSVPTGGKLRLATLRRSRRDRNLKCGLCSDGPACLRAVDLNLLRFLRTRGHWPPVERAVVRYSRTGEHSAIWFAIAALGLAFHRGATPGLSTAGPCADGR